MAALIFCAKLIISTGLLYGYYYFFLRNKRFHSYNRFYLLAASLISLVIPFLSIPVNLFWAGRQHPVLIQTLKVIDASGWEAPITIYAHQNFWSRWINLQTGLYCIYLAGLITGLILLIKTIFYINSLRKKYPFEKVDHLTIYNTTEPGTPFSFFRSIFWDQKLALDDARGQQIFRHELFHVKEKHSADILLIEILCCACWFNPFFHLIKKEIKAIHEFLADEYAASASNRYDYAELLVLHAISHKAPSVAHPFFHTQIKRRITMITQSNLVRHSGYFSRIMALPLLFILVSAFAIKLTSKPSPLTSSHRAGKNITVVVDAGHGGTFPGTNNIGMQEKDITLQISQKIKQLSAEYNVNVVLTRNDDKLVGNATNLREDLLNRVEITNSAKADAFISIHVNVTPEKSTTLSGFEVYVSRKRKDPKSNQLASTILTSLKNTYAVKEMIQQRDEGIIVIDKSNCPSIVLECGYLNNERDEAFITDKKNQEKIARNILEGIIQYGNSQAGNSLIQKDTITKVTFTRADKASADTMIKVVYFTRSISPEELSRLSVDDIKSISADMAKTTGYVYMKNGDTKSFNIKEVNDYYTANHLEGELKGYLTNVDMKDSAVSIRFTKDTVPSAKQHGDIVFTKVEVEAGYPGGKDGWKKFIISHIKYPQAAIDKNIKGTVVIQFIVDENGDVSDVKAISGPEILKAESIRIIKESGKWDCAMQNGKKVKAYKRQPINYALEPATNATEKHT